MLLSIFNDPVFLACICIVILLILASTIRVVPNNCVWITEVRKRFYKEMQAGIHFFIPFIVKVAEKVTLDERKCDFFFKDIKTKDDKILDCGVTLTYKIENAKLYYYNKSIANITKECTIEVANNLNFDELIANRDNFIDKIYLLVREISTQIGINVFQINVYFE